MWVKIINTLSAILLLLGIIFMGSIIYYKHEEYKFDSFNYRLDLCRTYGFYCDDIPDYKIH